MITQKSHAYVSTILFVLLDDFRKDTFIVFQQINIETNIDQ